VAARSGPWRFHDSHLTRAVDAWKSDHHPSTAQIAAFYDWAAEVAEIGPTGDPAMPAGDEDEWLSRVPEAHAIVSYLAVAQDRVVFVRSIEPTW